MQFMYSRLRNSRSFAEDRQVQQALWGKITNDSIYMDYAKKLRFLIVKFHFRRLELARIGHAPTNLQLSTGKVAQHPFLYKPLP